MDPLFEQKIVKLRQRREEIEGLLAQPDAAADMASYRRLNKEYGEIGAVLDAFDEKESLLRDVANFEEMESEPDLRADALAEKEKALAKLAQTEERIQFMLLPKDKDDDKDVILEIRAGAGGDEAALFAAELMRMYLRYAEAQGWEREILSTSESELGGCKEAICRIGGGCYSSLKYESGVHRVQRVPETESQGRVHTSTCTVAVMPEADELDDVVIDPKDIRIDVFRASGAGGQHIQKTSSAVRITHFPTGLVCECQDSRSQHQNKASAMRVLRARLAAMQKAEAMNKESSARRALIGSGDRSERIRTYNFPQGRVTDHRINLTLHKIDAVMNGDLGDLVSALIEADKAQQIAEMAQA